MPRYRPPAFYLPLVIRTSAAHIVPAIPLKPSPRVVFINPTFLAPHRERLASIHPEEVELRVMFVGAFLLKFCFGEPILRKLFGAVPHVHATERAKREHLFGRQPGLKASIEMFAHWLGQRVPISLLHPIAYTDELHYTQSSIYVGNQSALPFASSFCLNFEIEKWCLSLFLWEMVTVPIDFQKKHV
jgi:hypothetical protein